MEFKHEFGIDVKALFDGKSMEEATESSTKIIRSVEEIEKEITKLNRNLDNTRKNKEHYWNSDNNSNNMKRYEMFVRSEEELLRRIQEMEEEKGKALENKK